MHSEQDGIWFVSGASVFGILGQGTLMSIVSLVRRFALMAHRVSQSKPDEIASPWCGQSLDRLLEDLSEWRSDTRRNPGGANSGSFGCQRMHRIKAVDLRQAGFPVRKTFGFYFGENKSSFDLVPETIRLCFRPVRKSGISNRS
jgi:hypothetical protein